MKLYGVTTTYNEEILVPIVMPYLEKRAAIFRLF